MAGQRPGRHAHLVDRGRGGNGLEVEAGDGGRKIGDGSHRRGLRVICALIRNAVT
jgi:hypothetical protein